MTKPIDESKAQPPSLASGCSGAVVDYYEPPDYWDFNEEGEAEPNPPDCEVCGGEFWDGGTSCTCITDDWGTPRKEIEW